ncbi:hypothetical protein T05_15650 [Trichinella murrelli]|uniref:Uncharacterized protein n=1 Tax=Trichinella murrelli TaxID=144512 RepID=A0A0V0TU88_9BILA|nr:hypothetical protein T05_15650 [Trichinella murrelli]
MSMINLSVVSCVVCVDTSDESRLKNVSHRSPFRFPWLVGRLSFYFFIHPPPPPPLPSPPPPPPPPLCRHRRHSVAAAAATLSPPPPSLSAECVNI